MNKKNIFTNLICVFLILSISIILYHKPLFSNKPLGLDTLGHLSKIAYLKEFGLTVQWDLSWYNGAPFLAYYSPLYYFLVYFFDNIIFGANLLCCISIFLTSLGIFLLINYYSKNKFYSLIFSLFFLSILCTSYYYICVGNLPYIFSIFTVPFTLLFLEKSISNKKYSFFVYSLFFVLAYLSHIFAALTLFLLVVLRININYILKKNKKNTIKNLIKENFIYLLIPMLISSFWFLPFLFKSKSFIGDEKGYIPTIINLFGFGNYIIWGKSAGEIGILFSLFIISLFFIKKYLKEKNEKIIFLIASSILFFLLLEGILGKFYPTGVGAIRFILPFSILICIVPGIIFSEKFKNNKKVMLFLIFLLILGLFINYKVIKENYEKYSYSSPYNRYGLINYVYSSKDFPLRNNYSNYRFGTSKYIFSETLNYKFPWQSQTWGYFDQGILYPEELNKFKEAVWSSKDINETILYLDKFAIKYFEIGGENLIFDGKFNKSDEFYLIMKINFFDYPFKIYEYKKAKPIISVLFNNFSYEFENNYKVIRNNPDKVILNYNFSGNEIIYFKESFHRSWKAFDKKNKKNITIKKTKEGFMMLTPEKGANEVIIIKTRAIEKKIGIILSIIGILLMIYYSFIGFKKD
ncbi:MAG: EpsG family protein [Candidatus Pacearchaeota archaeon]